LSVFSSKVRIMRFRLIISIFLLLVMLIPGVLLSFGCNPPGEVVHFPDAKLEAVIRDILKQPDGDIYTSDLAKIENIKAESKHITNLTGLEYCTNLNYFILIDNQVSDLTPILHLPKLQGLWLENCRIQNIPDFSGLPKLEYLALNNNKIIDITPLKGLVKLKMLSLNGNQVSDISILATLTNLVTLDFRNNLVTDLSPLANLKNLSGIDCANNLICDISPLADMSLNIPYKMPDLKISETSVVPGQSYISMVLSGNKIEDIAPLVTHKLQEGVSYTYWLDDNPLNQVSEKEYILRLNLDGALVNY
jgi:hypothetical protein